MNILVLLKAVAGNTRGYTKAEREATELIANPADLTALEEALKIKDREDSTVTVLSMGPGSVTSILKDTLARGADRAVLLCDEAFAGADTAATSRTIAEAIRRLGPFDLVICGRKTTDGETGQVGPEVAVRTGLPMLLNVCFLRVEEDFAEVQCLCEEGLSECRCQLPALVSVVYGINSPRLPSLSGIRKANRTAVDLLGRSDLQMEIKSCGQAGSPTRVAASSAISFQKRSTVFLGPGEVIPVIEHAQEGDDRHG